MFQQLTSILITFVTATLLDLLIDGINEQTMNANQ